MAIREYPSVEAYEEAVKVFEVFTKIVLFAFAGQQPPETMDKIIRNFIARSVVTLRSILELWKIQAYSDCWVLHRCIMDRLFYLKSLAKGKAFDAFDDWCLKQQYEYMNKVRSDPEFKGRVGPSFFKDMERYKARYNELCKRGVDWRRPRAEDVAMDAGWGFLYKYAYDHASSHVHPMANDGEQEFHRLTKLAEPRDCGDSRLVLNNSCLAALLLVQEGLNISNFRWRRVVFDFLGDFLAFLQDASRKYAVTYCKIISLGPDFEVCEKTDKKGAFDE